MDGLAPVEGEGLVDCGAAGFSLAGDWNNAPEGEGLPAEGRDGADGACPGLGEEPLVLPPDEAGDAAVPVDFAVVDVRPLTCPAVAGEPAPGFAAPAGEGLSAEKAVFSLRTTGASTVEEADLTNSPMSLSFSRTALLSTPRSLANSYTRCFGTQFSPILMTARICAVIVP